MTNLTVAFRNSSKDSRKKEATHEKEQENKTKEGKRKILETVCSNKRQ